MHELESQYVRDQIARRGMRLNDKRTNPEGDYVLYWMQSTHRIEENWALRFAVLQADRLNKPLLIHQGLDPTYEHANHRIHSFILHNARELAARARDLGYAYRFVLRHARDDDRRVVDRLAARAALVVTDLYPTAGIAERSRRFADRVSCRVVAIESHAIVPSGVFQKEEYAARTIRSRLKAFLPLALQPVEDRPAHRPMSVQTMAELPGDALDLHRANLSAEIARCEVDQSVPPSPIISGRTAALARLQEFCGDALQDYSNRRSEPADEKGSSRLSPYLHFGQLPAAEVARAAMEAGPPEEVDAFLDELVTWRELSLNFCLRNPRFATLDALPAWVHKTMDEHRGDRREASYTLEEFETATTHDELWNAAQRELVRTGVMHNVVRMLWGKHIILWSDTYRDALDWMILLNNKYGLDGRDPSSFAGIQWCFGKFDRPFAGRPVLGTIRPMSLKRARDKWDVETYVKRWSD